MDIKDRIIRLDRVLGSELIPNPKNWRNHPPGQRDALKGVLDDVGIANAVIARETEEGLQLIDGHLRIDELQEQMVPVLVLDVNEEEADKILLTLDPLASMAETDNDAVRALMEDLIMPSAAVREMLSGLLKDETVSSGGKDDTRMLLDQSVQLKPQREYIVVMCDNDAEFATLIELLQLKTVRRGGYKQPAKTREEIGIERVITARRLLDACSNSE